MSDDDRLGSITNYGVTDVYRRCDHCSEIMHGRNAEEVWAATRDHLMMCHGQPTPCPKLEALALLDAGVQPVLDPELYDGLTSDQCLFQWWDNRSCIERGYPLLYAMTPEQIAAAKCAHAMETGQSESAALRAKVEASEAERKRREVSVCLQVDAEDVPWRE